MIGTTIFIAQSTDLRTLTPQTRRTLNSMSIDHRSSVWTNAKQFLNSPFGKNGKSRRLLRTTPTSANSSNDRLKVLKQKSPKQNCRLRKPSIRGEGNKFEPLRGIIHCLVSERNHAEKFPENTGTRRSITFWLSKPDSRSSKQTSRTLRKELHAWRLNSTS